jgi:lycopene beta-cyclase
VWDHVFVGGGIAACSLARRIVRDGLGSVLILEHHETPERTFAFWADGSVGVEGLVSHAWSRLGVAGWDASLELPLREHRYAMIEDRALREATRREVEAAGGRVVYDHVVAVEDGAEHATVRVASGEFLARNVYDSRYTPPPDAPVQAFESWWIETSADAFDPRSATLMDFRAPQQAGRLVFFHALPVTPRRAFVTGVAIGRAAQAPDLAAWLYDRLGPGWRRVGRERGVTTLDTRALPRRAGARILRIGRAGGLLEPSTGYAFRRIQDDAEAIARSLRRHGHPFAVPRPGRLRLLLDRVLLAVLDVHGEGMVAVFTALFAHNPVDRVLRFLDDRARWWEVAALVASMPRWGWFLAALVRGPRRLLAAPAAR